MIDVLAQRYGCRPSELLRGGVFDLSFDVEVLRAGRFLEREQAAAQAAQERARARSRGR